METVEDIIRDSLQEILVQAAEVPLVADEAQTAIRFLNRMMAELDSRGISLGFTRVSSLSDFVTVPDGAISGVVSNLAVRLAPQYDQVPSGELLASARTGLSAMAMLSVDILPTSYGDTLPTGDGNHYTGDSAFYPDEAAGVANETGGYIEKETNTELP